MGWVSVTMGDWMNFWNFLKPDMDLSMGYVPNPRFVQKVQLPAFLGLSVFLTGDAAGADFTFNLKHHTHTQMVRECQDCKEIPKTAL